MNNNKKFSDLLIGEIRTFLQLGLSLRAIQKALKGKGIDISIAHLSNIKNGKEKKPGKVPDNFRTGPKQILSERQNIDLVAQVKSDNPPTQLALASKYHVSQQLISLQLKRNGIRRLKKPVCHRINETTQEKRRMRSFALYKRLCADRWQKFITVDEALFHVNESGVQSQFQYLEQDQHRSELSVRETQNFPKGVMVFVGMSHKGLSKPIFVEPGAKISSNYYINKVLKPFFADVRKNLYPDNDFVFHQDSAPSHTAKATLEYLKQENIKFVWPNEWLPNSPDAAPCDYFLWGYVKGLVRKTKITNIDELKKSIRTCLRKVPQEMIDNALAAWPKRLLQIYEAMGSHIENKH